MKYKNKFCLRQWRVCVCLYFVIICAHLSISSSCGYMHTEYERNEKKRRDAMVGCALSMRAKQRRKKIDILIISSFLSITLSVVLNGVFQHESTSAMAWERKKYAKYFRCHEEFPMEKNLSLFLDDDRLYFVSTEVNEISIED